MQHLVGLFHQGQSSVAPASSFPSSKYCLSHFWCLHLMPGSGIQEHYLTLPKQELRKELERVMM